MATQETAWLQWPIAYAADFSRLFGWHGWLRQFPTEGKVVRGGQGVNVGDSIHVRLVSVDVPNGFIDFERKYRFTSN